MISRAARAGPSPAVRADPTPPGRAESTHTGKAETTPTAPADRKPGARPLRRGHRKSRIEAPVGPFAVFTIVASLTFLLAGIAWPQGAVLLLRLLLVTLAVGFIVARAYAAMLPSRTTQDFYSPFELYAASRPPAAAPQELQNLAAELGAADDARLARQTAIPWPVRRTVIEEASRRLTEHRGLRLGDPSHHAGIRSLVSEPTWRLIGPGKRGARPKAQLDAVSQPTLSQLGLILDDLESL